MDHQEKKSCCHVTKKWYQQPLIIILIIIGLLFGLNYILVINNITLINPVIIKFIDYLKKTWWAIGLGFIIGGLIDVLVPQQLMVKLLASGKRSVILATLLGFLASACSHGILAISMSLYKKGASTASTLAFLLAAPWANISITLLLFSLFGLKALIMVIGALLIAIVSGFIFDYLEKNQIIEGGKTVVKSHEKITWQWPGTIKLINRVIHSSMELIKSIGWWILFGFLISSILGSLIPEYIFHNFFGPTFFGLIATLIMASLIEVCSEGSAPMAFEIYDKTKAFGNTFVFLQAGVVTDYTEIGLIWTNIGKRAAIVMMLAGIPQILLLGMIFNRLF